MDDTLQSARTTVRRLPSRASYDRATVYRILDAGLVCHVGFVHEGQPLVLPMAYGRMDDKVLLHGSVGSRMLRTLAAGAPVCITVTHVDGLVLARSMFHHSMNYRSVVILGTAVAIEERAEKMEALRVLSEHLVPGRWAAARIPNEKELKQTLVLAVPIQEASVKIRTGPPKDDPEDLMRPVWAGVLPLEIHVGQPIADAGLVEGVRPVPHLVPRGSAPRTTNE